MKTININYNREGDLLEICIGKPTEAYFEEVEDGFFERVERKTGKRKGFIILNFKKRVAQARNNKLIVEEFV